MKRLANVFIIAAMSLFIMSCNSMDSKLDNLEEYVNETIAIIEEAKEDGEEVDDLDDLSDKYKSKLEDAIKNFDKDAFLKTADCAKSLVLKLEEFKSVVVLSAQNRTVYTICRYVQELAAEFHSFYNANRVICDDKELMKSRLALMVAIKTTLKNALDILAVSAPERM